MIKINNNECLIYEYIIYVFVRVTDNAQEKINLI